MAAVRTNQDTFHALVTLAERLEDDGALEASVGMAQIAAHFAWHNHAGVFASPAIESLLRRVAAIAECDVAVPTGVGPIVHVATTMNRYSGHTSLLTRWIEADEHRPRIVFTDQRRRVPPDLRRVTQARGGEIFLLDPNTTTRIGRARALRAHVDGAHAVVLHIHPFDVVALLALAIGHRPPVAFVNHADHVFWIGTDAPDVVLNLRPSATQLCLGRRGFHDSSLETIPIPLSSRPRTRSRTDAKAALAVDPDAVLLVTLATSLKCADQYLHLVADVLTACPGAVLIAQGLHPTAAWERAMAQFRPRLCLRPAGDPALILEAADVYLDSYPFGSTTSLLEAVSYGTPAVTLAESPSVRILASDDLAFADRPIWCESATDYVARVKALVADEAVRTAEGRILAKRVASAHSHEAFRNALARVYGRLERSSDRFDLLPASPHRAARAPDLLDERLERIYAHDRGLRLPEIISYHRGIGGM